MIGPARNIGSAYSIPADARGQSLPTVLLGCQSSLGYITTNQARKRLPKARAAMKRAAESAIGKPAQILSRAHRNVKRA